MNLLLGYLVHWLLAVHYYPLALVWYRPWSSLKFSSLVLLDARKISFYLIQFLNFQYLPVECFHEGLPNVSFLLYASSLIIFVLLLMIVSSFHHMLWLCLNILGLPLHCHLLDHLLLNNLVYQKLAGIVRQHQHRHFLLLVDSIMKNYILGGPLNIALNDHL